MPDPTVNLNLGLDDTSDHGPAVESAVGSEDVSDVNPDASLDSATNAVSSPPPSDSGEDAPAVEPEEPPAPAQDCPSVLDMPPYAGSSVVTYRQLQSMLENVQKIQNELQGFQKRADIFPGAALQWHGGSAYMSTGQLGQDIVAYQQYANRRTGYSNLDRMQPLYPGLYVLGAISSLGKTTFALQLGDQLAANGEHVLYFSLEQSRFEVLSKSLARIIRQNNQQAGTGSDYTSIQIRRGDAVGTPEIARATADYNQAIGERMSVIEGNFSVTIENIEATVDAYMKQTGQRPVVIIDYLQIVTPTMVNGRQPDSKTAIDHIVHSIKSYQSQHNLTVIVISSLNRQNYLAPIDFESFKESGGIEYTADVVWGLQLWAIHNDIFNQNSKIKEKRDIIRMAKAATPREIELVCLKNRYGISSYTADFDYDPAYDTFIPCGIPLEVRHANDNT